MYIQALMSEDKVKWIIPYDKPTKTYPINLVSFSSMMGISLFTEEPVFSFGLSF